MELFVTLNKITEVPQFFIGLYRTPTDLCYPYNGQNYFCPYTARDVKQRDTSPKTGRNEKTEQGLHSVKFCTTPPTIRLGLKKRTLRVVHIVKFPVRDLKHENLMLLSFYFTFVDRTVLKSSYCLCKRLLQVLQNKFFCK